MMSGINNLVFELDRTVQRYMRPAEY